MGDLALTFVQPGGETAGQRRKMLAVIAFLVSLTCLFVSASINGASTHFYPRLVSDDISIGPILDEYSSYVIERIIGRPPVINVFAAYCILTESDCYAQQGLMFGLSFSIVLMFLWALVIHVLVGYIAMSRQPIIDFELFRRRVFPACAAVTLSAGVVLLLLELALDLESTAALIFSAFFSAFALLTVFAVGLPLSIGLIVLRLRGDSTRLGQRWK